MTGKQFKAIRKNLALTAEVWGRALGYSGLPGSVSRVIRHYESGDRPVPTRTKRLAIMYKKHGIPEEWL